MIELDKALRLTAARTMRDIPLVRDALLWVQDHPKNFEQRVDKFNDATADVSEAVVLGGKMIKGRRGLTALKRAYRQANCGEPTSLHDLVSTYKSAREEQWEGWEKDLQDLDASVSAVRENLLNGSLRLHPQVFAHPPTFLTRLMVEGYALELSNFYKEPKVVSSYKKALSEVLSEKDYRRTLLEDDVSYWTLLEQEDPSSLTTLLEFQESRLKAEPDSLSKNVQEINAHFREGGDASGVVDQLRRFPRPIAVDFNNVIANNAPPLQLNPDAPEFLTQLREVGNVFIVTAADSWVHVQRFFIEHKLWTQDMVLMTYPSYMFLNEYGGYRTEAKNLRAEFNEMARNVYGKEFSEDDLARSKRIAPLFCKPWEIPIIDDSYFSTEHNPGMLGIQVKTWEPGQYEPEDRYNKGLPSLPKAVEIVREHYSKIPKA